MEYSKAMEMQFIYNENCCIYTDLKLNFITKIQMLIALINAEIVLISFDKQK